MEVTDYVSLNAVRDGKLTRPYRDPDFLKGASFGKVLEAAWAVSKQAGTSEMSMEEIIAEIEEARRDDQATAGS